MSKARANHSTSTNPLMQLVSRNTRKCHRFSLKLTVIALSSISLTSISDTLILGLTKCYETYEFCDFWMSISFLSDYGSVRQKLSFNTIDQVLCMSVISPLNPQIRYFLVSRFIALNK